MNNIDIFPWDDNFNTGIQTIDEQHKKLVVLLNRLATLVAYQSNDDTLNTIFDELTEYTLYHFQTEEAIWHQNIDEKNLTDEHDAIHQKFIDIISTLKEKQNTKPLHQLADEALEFVAKWLASHILESDRYMANIVLGIQKGLSFHEAKLYSQEQMSGSSRILVEIILSIYSTLSKNTLHLMRELQNHNSFEKKLTYQNKYRNLLLELSTSFINLPIENIDNAIEDTLEKMGTFTHADRAYIFDYNVKKQTTSNTYEWCAQDISPQIDELQNIPIDFIEDWYDRHSKGEYILIQDVFSLEDGNNIRDILLPQGIKSIIAIPILEKNTCIGFVGFDAVKKQHTFTETEIKLLRHYSELLANVTLRRKSELALSYERTFLKTLIQAIPDLVWMKDLDGVYMVCNSRFEDFFGVKELDIIGKTDYDFVEKSLADFFRSHDKHVMENGKPNINEEEVPFAKDGHKEILHTTKVPMYDANKKLLGVLGVGRDITQLKLVQKELEKKERYQRAVLDNFPFLVWLKDKESNFLAVNQPFADACGIESAEQLIGKNDFDIWPKELAKAYRADDAEVLKSGQVKNVEERLQSGNENLWIETYKSPVSLDNHIIGSVGYARDISERKKDEENLRLAANVFTHSREGIIIASHENKILDVNNSVERITGYTRDDLLGENPKILSSGKNEQSLYTHMWEELNKKGFWSGELSNRHKGGELYTEMVTITTVKDENGDVKNYVALFSDITTLKNHQEHLEYIAHYDALTGLPNRVLFSDRLQQSIAHTRRSNSTLAVVYLDLDGFKEVNDLHGHEAGDHLLNVISNRMKSSLREGDTIARIGGDEFVAVLPDLHKHEECIPMIQRLLKTSSGSVDYNQLSMNVTASIGVSFFHAQDTSDADQLLRYADQAMYQAKLSGKNRFHIFDAIHDATIRTHHEKLENIENALINNEFELYYQPKVNMRTGRVIGMEALIRWKHPSDGIVTPGDFLPSIDGNELSVRLGQWVLEEAIQQINHWKKNALSFVISINIDAMHLLQGNILQEIQKLLKKYPLVQTSDFQLEILETSALEDITRVIQIMQDCKKIGVLFSLDDFGTGYSSLTYLKRLPASELKIDQSFVRDMLQDTDDLAILDGIINLANTFKRTVIAEGVESIEQGEALLHMGCELAQGYAIAKPMPAHEVQKWFEEFKPYQQWLNLKPYSKDDLTTLYNLVEKNAL